jgi:hypothetical protein
LKPAKPLPAGKKVKCPKCGTLFAAGEPADGIATKPRPEPAGAKKKPPDKPQLPRPGKDDDEEEDSKGIYAFVDDGTGKEEEEDEDKPRKPKINYAPDMSIKDLRGPAQSAIMRPSNALIFVGIMGFLGWLGLIVVLLIPVVFPLVEADADKPKPAKGVGPGLAAASVPPPPANPFGGGGGGGAAKSGDKKPDEEGKSAFDVAGLDFSLLAVMAWWLMILAILPLVLGMVYCGFLTFGAVKMQNLESRAWGIAGSILALLPLNTGGLMFLTAFLCNWLLNMFFDDPAFSMYVAIVLMSIQTTISVAVGIWNLVVLMRPEVIEGFEYVPEYGTEGAPT